MSERTKKCRWGERVVKTPEGILSIQICIEDEELSQNDILMYIKEKQLKHPQMTSYELIKSTENKFGVEIKYEVESTSVPNLKSDVQQIKKVKIKITKRKDLL